MSSSSAGAERQPDYDPSRALLTLNQIQPPPPVPSGPHTDTPLSAPSAELLQRARVLERDHLYVEAALELEQALEADPSSPEVHRGLARLYLSSGAHERARSHAVQTLELHGNDGTGHYVLAMLAVASGESAEALRRFRIALQCPDVASNPARLAMTHYRLALCLEGDGYLTAALEQYRAYERQVTRVEETPPDDPELAKLIQVDGRSAAAPIATICERLGRFDEAADALEQLLTDGAEPDPELQARYARMLARAGKIDRALAVTRAIEGDHTHRVTALTEIHRLAGHPHRVVDDLRALLRSQPDEPVLIQALADALADAGRTAEAEQTLRRFADGNPDDPNASWMLFDYLVRRSRWADALGAADAVLDRHPDEFVTARSKMTALAQNADAVAALLDSTAGAPDRSHSGYAFLLGCLILETGQTEAARRWFDRSLELSPSFVGSRIELGRLYLKAYRWEEAIGVASREGESRPELERILGQAHAGLDDHDQAIAHYSQAIELNRSDTASMRALAELLQRTDKLIRARRQYELILKENPLDGQAREALTMLCLQVGDRQAAAEQISELQKMAAPAQTVARCVARFQFRPRAPDFAGWRQILLGAVGEQRPEPETAFLLASSFIAERDFASAGAYVEQGLSADPDHEGLQELRIGTHRQQLEFEEAEERLRVLVRQYPNRMLWLDNLLDMLLIQQKHEDAIALSRSMLELDGLSPAEIQWCRRELVAALRSVGRSDEAVAQVRSWCDDDPTNDVLRELLIDTLLLDRQYDEALAFARSWHGEDDGQAARSELLRVLVQGERFDRACQWIVQWLEGDPFHEGLHSDLIRTLTAAGRFDDAVEIAQANYDRAPGSRVGYEYLALQAHDAAGRHDEAIRLIQQWIYRSERGLADDFPFAPQLIRGLLVEQFLAAGRLDDARKWLNRWISDEQSPLYKIRYLTLLSECDRRIGRIDQALDALELAHGLNPLDVDVCNSLGYSWADAGLRLDEADALIRYAVAQEPRNAAYLDSLGWVLYKKRDFRGARYWLELATGADDTDDPVIHDHLGDTCWRLGEREAATAQWRTAVESARKGFDEGRVDPTWREVLERTPNKIDAVSSDEAPAVAPAPEADRPALQAVGNRGTTRIETGSSLGLGTTEHARTASARPRPCENLN
ncbi:MAG: tetratricopeptide repeat protein [Phycisphaerales bacterium]|nr:MAG: tetratricopeptide repeat protein [Phycisphaerales bacterium]